jgi:hypothetical protein
MTCIIGHRDGWMVADVAHSFTDLTRVPCYTSKLCHWALPAAAGRIKIMWATCGSAVLHDKTVRAVEDDAIQELTAVFRAHPGEGEALVVCGTGDLYHIASSGALMRLTAEYWAIGSGYQAALGYLRGQHEGLSEAHVTIEEAKRAIGFASELCMDVSKETTDLSFSDFG